MNDKTKITLTLKQLKRLVTESSDEPASKKQLWALYCIYHKDFRDQGLTKAEASDLIENAPNKSSRQNERNIESKIKEHIETVLKPQLDAQMKACFGNQSIIRNDIDKSDKRTFKFFENGLGMAWIEYDKRNKKLGEITGKYLEIYRNKYFRKFANEYIRKYHEEDMGGVLSQDLEIQITIKHCALDFAKSLGINTDHAYVANRLD